MTTGAAVDPARAAGTHQSIGADHSGRVVTADVTGRAAGIGVGGDDRVFERGAAVASFAIPPPTAAELPLIVLADWLDRGRAGGRGVGHVPPPVGRGVDCAHGGVGAAGPCHHRCTARRRRSVAELPLRLQLMTAVVPRLVLNMPPPLPVAVLPATVTPVSVVVPPSLYRPPPFVAASCR